jgi:hypothetical protein
MEAIFFARDWILWSLNWSSYFVVILWWIQLKWHMTNNYLRIYTFYIPSDSDTLLALANRFIEIQTLNDVVFSTWTRPRNRSVGSLILLTKCKQRANCSCCETLVPWVPTDQAHSRPRQVGSAHQKNRRPNSGPNRFDLWPRKPSRRFL